jgi:hypothetical protein
MLRPFSRYSAHHDHRRTFLIGKASFYEIFMINSNIARLEVVVQQNREHTLFMASFLAGLCQDGLGERYGFPQERAASIFKLHFPVFYARFDLLQSKEAQNQPVKRAQSILPPLSYPSNTLLPKTESLAVSAHLKAMSDAAIRLPHIFRQALELCPHDQAEAMLDIIRQAAGRYLSGRLLQVSISSIPSGFTSGVERERHHSQ